MKENRIFLECETPDEPSIPSDILARMLDALNDGMRQAVRFSLEGESTRRGAVPKWLEDACATDFLGLQKGSVGLRLRSAPLSVSLSARGIPPAIAEKTPFDVFSDVLCGLATSETPQGVTADGVLVETCIRFARAFGRCCSSVRVEKSGLPEGYYRIGKKEIERFERIRQTAPLPSAMRLTGVLDTISNSEPTVMIMLKDGRKYKIRLETDDIEKRKKLLGQRVSVEGIASFSLNGDVTALEAHDLESPRFGDEAFTSVIRMPSLARPPLLQEKVNFDAIPQWDGNETPEELMTMLREIRR